MNYSKNHNTPLHTGAPTSIGISLQYIAVKVILESK